MTDETDLPLDAAALDYYDNCIKNQWCARWDTPALIAQSRAALALSARVADLEQERTAYRASVLEEAAALADKASHEPGAQGYSGGPKYVDMTKLAAAIRALTR